MAFGTDPSDFPVVWRKGPAISGKVLKMGRAPRLRQILVTADGPVFVEPFRSVAFHRLEERAQFRVGVPRPLALVDRQCPRTRPDRLPDGKAYPVKAGNICKSGDACGFRRLQCRRKQRVGRGRALLVIGSQDLGENRQGPVLMPLKSTSEKSTAW